MNREALNSMVEDLSKLSESQLLVLLNLTFDKIKKENLDFEESYIFANTLFDPSYDDCPGVYVYALPVNFINIIDELISCDVVANFGACPKCKTEVNCVTKEAICPVCGYIGIECT